MDDRMSAFDRNINKIIGEKIHFLRTGLLCISCIKFAEYIGISRYRLIRIEQGEVQIPASLIRKISLMFEIPAEWILCMDTDEKQLDDCMPLYDRTGFE